VKETEVQESLRVFGNPTGCWPLSRLDPHSLRFPQLLWRWLEHPAGRGGVLWVPSCKRQWTVSRSRGFQRSQPPLGLGRLERPPVPPGPVAQKRASPSRAATIEDCHSTRASPQAVWRRFDFRRSPIIALDIGHRLRYQEFRATLQKCGPSRCGLARRAVRRGRGLDELGEAGTRLCSLGLSATGTQRGARRSAMSLRRR
jgi:hypothetical protein